MSPICVVTTCSTEVLSTTCCSVLAKFSTTTTVRAPESLSWYSSSRAV
jgi:hypothetical protein